MRLAIIRPASLLALAVTAFALPLAGLVAHAPTSGDATLGFRQAELSSADIAAWLVAAATFFTLCFAVACAALARRAHRPMTGTHRPRTNG